MLYSLSLLVLLFFVYSFIGWIHEIIYRLITERKFYTTGFLTMPILPIYGTGATVILLLVDPYFDNPFVVFALSVVIASVLEYTTHLILDKLFHIQLWDYSKKRFNLQGRICLENSLGFGILALLLVYVLHPLFSGWLGMIPDSIAIIIAIVLSSLLIIDFANSVISLVRVRMSAIKGTLKAIWEHLVNELSIITTADPTKRKRLIRIRRALLRLHELNLRRLTRAYPNAQRK
ncbi:MAG: putative ABC transporter permease [Candidatus Microsaccharimonas sp.]|jgi:uncharacterized membrane protein